MTFTIPRTESAARLFTKSKKHHLRALFRSVSFLLLVIGYSSYNFYFGGATNNGHFLRNTQTNSKDIVSDNKNPLVSEQIYRTKDQSINIKDPLDNQFLDFQEEIFFRFLQDEVEETATETETESEDETCNKAESWYMLLLYVLGVVYLFLALAVVVDEFFVPALEEMSSERHMNLSMDVAGATLMAAGGSAPELFTSLFGTFAESDVGFGTIVGSAVFNVLFVIACVCLLSKEVLSLTWWPLFRDCTYYVISLIVLAVFVAVVTPEEIYAWEAIVLFVMYLGYVLIMKYNAQLYNMITKNDHEDIAKEQSKNQSALLMSTTDLKNADGDAPTARRETVRSFMFPGTFRAGVLKMMRNPGSWVDTGGVGIVSKIAGDVNATFAHVDTDNNGFLSKEELRTLFAELDNDISDSELDDVMTTLDEDNDGKISQSEFTAWYLKSEARFRNGIKFVFDKIDKNGSGHIEKSEVKTLMKNVVGNVTDEDVEIAINEMRCDGDEGVSFEAFSKWLQSSDLYDKHIDTVDTAIDGVFAFLKPPCDEGAFAVLIWFVTLPIVATLSVTIPDVRKPGRDKWCYLAFVLAIVWVGVYSKFMVDWAAIIGATFGIPDVVMGLTFLAAGTSVPDLLSSVIVAKRGEGDMAVSSSIGSNIFDILVGLPLPWLLFTLWNNGKNFVTISADGIWISIIILLVMVVCIIATIHFSGWKLTKRVAFVMFVLYFAFLAQAIVQQLPFDKVCA